MTLVALFIGIVLIVAAIRGTQGVLFSALGQDVPGFVVWGAALFAVGAIGYVPGLKPVSRGLLALVIIVIVLRNYASILAGFSGLSLSGSQATTDTTAPPATGQTPANPNPASNPPTTLINLLSGASDITQGFGGMAA